MITPQEQVGNGGVPASRTAEFSTGQVGEQNPLNHASVLTNPRPAQPHPFTPEGVLMSVNRFSGIGSSAQDNERRFLGSQGVTPEMSSFNGSSPAQKEKIMALRASTGNEEA